MARGKHCIENVGEESVETNYPIIPIWVSATLYIGISVNSKTNKTKQNFKKEKLSYSKHYTLWYYREDIIPDIEDMIFHWYSIFNMSLEGLLKQISVSNPTVSDSVSLGSGPRIFIYDRFPGDADAVGLGITVRATVVFRPTGRNWG